MIKYMSRVTYNVLYENWETTCTCTIFFYLVQIIENEDCVLKMCYSIFVKRLISPTKNGLHLLRKNYLKIVLNLSGMNKCNVQLISVCLYSKIYIVLLSILVQKVFHYHVVGLFTLQHHFSKPIPPLYEKKIRRIRLHPT